MAPSGVDIEYAQLPVYSEPASMHVHSLTRESGQSSQHGPGASRSPGSCHVSHGCPPGRVLTARRRASSTNRDSMQASPVGRSAVGHGDGDLRQVCGDGSQDADPFPELLHPPIVQRERLAPFDCRYHCRSNRPVKGNPTFCRGVFDR